MQQQICKKMTAFFEFCMCNSISKQMEIYLEEIRNILGLHELEYVNFREQKYLIELNKNKLDNYNIPNGNIFVNFFQIHLYHYLIFFYQSTLLIHVHYPLNILNY